MTRYLYALLAVAALLVAVEQYGEHRVQVEWDKERARQEAVAERERQVDDAARKADKEQYKRDLENAKSKAGRAAVDRWLRDHGLLPDGTPVSSSGGGKTDCPTRVDGSAGQSGTGEHIAQFAEGCALDALQVLRWQEWAVREGLEVVSQ